jgi:diguanylate cyclase (GGDEF)-like protein
MHKLFLLPTIFNFVVVTLSPLYGLIFYVDANNYYQRGSVFFFFVLVYIINIIFFAIVTWRTGQKYLYPIKWKTASLSFLIVAGTCIQLVVPSVYSSWHCVTLSLLLLYILLSEFEGSFDTLTKFYNRAAFEKASKQLKGKKKFSVIIMDINKFKEINDTYGHEYGDTVLKEVAAIIREAFDDNCSCYRVGGDEFYIIRRDVNRDKLEHQLKSITNNLAKERQKDRCLPTVAYGYSIFEGDKTLDFQKILKEADDQMYYYKHLQKSI